MKEIHFKDGFILFVVRNRQEWYFWRRCLLFTFVVLLLLCLFSNVLNTTNDVYVPRFRINMF